MTTSPTHPRDALFDASEAAVSLPVCDHYAGVEARMRKSLELQGELGPVFDVTLDNEDGAPVGGEREHAHLIAELVNSPANRFGRVGARMLPVDHPAFADVAATLVREAGARLAYLMLPKPRHLADLERAAQEVDRLSTQAQLARPIPMHALIETHGALQQVQAIAAHPRIESLSFGLMDFVSAHRGAIPQHGMSVEGQFEHPLVVRAKLEIAAACHAHGKVPSHCVVTEFKNPEALGACAQKASRELGYTRMWSIHPDQIRPILRAFAPAEDEVLQAAQILTSAAVQNWAPISFGGVLHDRASYRYFWQLLERAHQTGQVLPVEVQPWFALAPTH